MYAMIDTFPEFLDLWARVRHRPIEVQIDEWRSLYMSQWPELLELQLHNYADEHVDWRQIAQERVFPFLDDRLPAMETAHHSLLEMCEPTYVSALEALDLEFDLVCVIYVGIGCGAGWATQYRGSPAILFGLENIAECGWQEPSSIAGLVAHELGHLAHYHLRAKCGKPMGDGPWWQLYGEGFARWCECEILGGASPHDAAGINDGDYLLWCQNHRAWLSLEFLKDIDNAGTVRRFFGSWFDIGGRKQCGHYLGHELIKELRATMSLKQIALLDDIDRRFRHLTEKAAQSVPIDPHQSSPGRSTVSLHG